MGREDQYPVDSDLVVSEAEGSVLGLVARRQPLTRYQILRAFQTSPISGLNTSKGSLYPLVRRLSERGLLEGKAGSGPRETEVLELTPRGYAALRAWVKSVSAHLTLQYDPLKFRAISLGELSRDERIQWIAAARQAIWAKREELEAYRAQIKLPYGKVVHSADEASLDAQLKWLDRLLVKVVNEEEPERRSSYDWDGEKL